MANHFFACRSWNNPGRMSDFCMLDLIPAAATAPAHHSRRQGEREICFRFGRRVRELRKAHGMTQARLATKFGINRSFLSDVEKGKTSIGLAMVEVIALGFQISLSELLKDL
jgi:ribosome-binding protein aMBF1 (putative translation factor)